MLQRPITTPQYQSLVQIGGVRGEKEWQDWAQDHVDWLDNQTKQANTRLPYASTLQLGSLETAGEQGVVRGEKEWQTWAQDLEDWGNTQTTRANTRLPYASTLQLSEQIGGIVRGEKEW